MGRKERVGATSKGRDWKRRKAKGNTRKGKERETEKEGRGRACPTNEKIVPMPSLRVYAPRLNSVSLYGDITESMHTRFTHFP